MRRIAAALLMSLLAFASAAHATVTAEAWDLYKQKFVMADGRVVDDVNGEISHSESQGYGLMLSCLANDPTTFARILGFAGHAESE